MQVMQQREEELRDINRKMHTVNAIYQDLGEVVEQQQDQIDLVEDQFGGTAEATRKGLEQIEKANTKRSWRKKDGTSNEEQPQGGVGSDKRKQFFLLHYLSKSASEVAKMVSVCAGSGSASYVHGESWSKKL